MSFVLWETGEESVLPAVKQQPQLRTFSAVPCTTLVMDHEIFLLKFKPVGDWNPQEYFSNIKVFRSHADKTKAHYASVKMQLQKTVFPSSRKLFFFGFYNYFHPAPLNLHLPSWSASSLTVRNLNVSCFQAQ